MTDPITVTVKSACEISGLSRTTIYRLIGIGKLRSAKIGRRTLISHASLLSLLDDSWVSSWVERTNVQKAK